VRPEEARSRRVQIRRKIVDAGLAAGVPMATIERLVRSENEVRSMEQHEESYLHEQERAVADARTRWGSTTIGKNDPRPVTLTLPRATWDRIGTYLGALCQLQGRLSHSSWHDAEPTRSLNELTAALNHSPPDERRANGHFIGLDMASEDQKNLVMATKEELRGASAAPPEAVEHGRPMTASEIEERRANPPDLP
jgi:hypothetical protein